MRHRKLFHQVRARRQAGCAGCAKLIEVGDPIKKEGGRWVHEGCTNPIQEWDMNEDSPWLDVDMDR